MKGEAPASGGLPASEFDHEGDVFLAGLQYLYNDDFNVALTFSQGFRAPNLQEAVMLGDTGKFFHIPNDSLEPESSDTFELTTNARISRLRIGCSGYVSVLDDLIKRVPATWQGQTVVNGKDVYENANGGDGLIYGAEAQLSLDVGHGVSLSGHASYTYGKENVKGGRDEPLTRIPPLFGQATLRWDGPMVGKCSPFVETYVRAAAKQNRLSAEDEADVRIPEGGTPSWSTWNLRLGLLAGEHVQVALTVENLLNEKYKYHGSGVYGPGRSAVLSATLVF